MSLRNTLTVIRRSPYVVAGSGSTINRAKRSEPFGLMRSAAASVSRII
jgi:hypothetical protein